MPSPKCFPIRLQIVENKQKRRRIILTFHECHELSKAIEKTVASNPVN